MITAGPAYTVVTFNLQCRLNVTTVSCGKAVAMVKMDNDENSQDGDIKCYAASKS